MRVEPTEIPEVLVVEPTVHRDDRGFFIETYRRDRYAEAGIPSTFVQDNLSASVKNTLRGLHTQLAPPVGKLVRVAEGEIFDVAVDLRVGSPTFLAWVGRVLDAESQRQLWVPEGFAHGFCALSERALVEYKCTQPWRSDDDWAFRWDDPEIGIEWPVQEPLLSDRDREAPTVREHLDRLPRYEAADGV